MHPGSAILTQEHSALAFMQGFETKTIFDLDLGDPRLNEMAGIALITTFGEVG